MAKHSRKHDKSRKEASRGNHAASGKPDNNRSSESLDNGKSPDDVRPEKGAGKDDVGNDLPVSETSEQQEDAASLIRENSDEDVTTPLEPVAPTVVPPGTFQKEKEELDPIALAEKKRRRKKAGLITAGSIVLFLAIVYIAGFVFFSGHFYPNTKIGSFDLSMKSQNEASQILSDGMENYSLNVSGQGLALTISAREIGLDLDTHEVTADALKSLALWRWPVDVFQQHDHSEYLAAAYHEGDIGQLIKVHVDQFNTTATQPVNATIAFDSATKRFKIVSESAGTALDYATVMKVVDGAIVTLTARADITKDELVQPTVFKDNPALKTAVDAADKMITADVILSMAGFTVTELGPAKISTWVRLDEKLAVTFDEAAFSAWIDEVTAGCNTVGGTRTFTRPDGKVVTVSGGTYGWKIDSDSLRTMIKNSVAAGYVGTLDVPVLQSGNGFAGLGGRDWGSRYCDIDISEQHARFYDASGALIWETDIITGKPDGKHNTPTGVYVVNSKASPSKLVGEIDPETKKPEYETTVSYWMPFVGNAIGLHDATWQPSFGGSMYKNGYGSHGCVNLPYSAASALYGFLQVGDVVVVHY